MFVSFFLWRKEERRGRRRRSSLWLVVGGNTKKKEKKKKKRRDKRASHSTLCIIDYGKCITFSCKIFIPIKYYIKEEKRRVKNGATRV